MTFGFVLLTVGAVLVLAGTRNLGITETLRGELGGPGPGERDFTGSGGGSAGGAVAGAANAATNAIFGDGKIVNFDGSQVCSWVAQELQYARANGWKGGINSGYRSEADQRRVCSESAGPCAEPGKSNHQGKAYPGCAVDVSDPAGLDRALSGKPGRKLHWTGRQINDDVHFSSGKLGV